MKAGEILRKINLIVGLPACLLFFLARHGKRKYFFIPESWRLDKIYVGCHMSHQCFWRRSTFYVHICSRSMFRHALAYTLKQTNIVWMLWTFKKKIILHDVSGSNWWNQMRFRVQNVHICIEQISDDWALLYHRVQHLIPFSRNCPVYSQSKLFASCAFFEKRILTRPV